MCSDTCCKISFKSHSIYTVMSSDLCIHAYCLFRISTKCCKPSSRPLYSVYTVLQGYIMSTLHCIALYVATSPQNYIVFTLCRVVVIGKYPLVHSVSKLSCVVIYVFCTSTNLLQATLYIHCTV